ncbi:transmembrane anchor protein, partial [Pseudomonas lactis]|nr:transmembrane anchor protein [Pseudomonas lactis]
MFNTPLPTVNELPTTRKLVRSTVIAMLVAAGLLVTVVMPSEYAIDPTGVGRTLGLTQMGELKITLAQEALADAAPPQPAASAPAPQ